MGTLSQQISDFFANNTPRSAVVGFLAVAAIFMLLEWLFPEDDEQKAFRSDLPADTLWYFTGYAARLVAGVISIALLVELTTHLPHATLPFISRQPVGFQLAEVMVIGDLYNYW